MENPLVTFVLFSYNQEEYIREAVEAALSQTYTPLEIIISDDCSKDKTFDIIQEIIAVYEGPHSIVLRKNEMNLGLTSHFNLVMRLAKSEYIIVAAGDDISLPWRTEVIVRHFQNNPSCVLLASFAQSFGDNQNTITPLLLNSDSRHNFVTRCKFYNEGALGCTYAYTKSLINGYPPLESKTYAEDMIYAFRAWELGTFELIPEVLLLYRRTPQSISNMKKEDPLLYEVKFFTSLIEQICIDLKYLNRTIDEISCALIYFRKIEINYHKRLIYQRNPSIFNALPRNKLFSKICKILTEGSICKRIGRKFERRKLHALVHKKWQMTMKVNTNSRAIPERVINILIENKIYEA